MKLPLAHIKSPLHPNGHILAGTMIVMGVAAIVLTGTLQLILSSNKTIVSSSKRSVEYFDTENALGNGVAWLRNNSTGLAQPFSRSNFYTLFDRSNPTLGTNDNLSFSFPTKIKQQGSNNSVILYSDATWRGSWFPQSVDTISGKAISPLSLFTSNSFGSKKLRITLVDAVALDPSKDFGDPDQGSPPPQTDFRPIYRLDGLESGNKGAHLYGYAVGALQYDYGVGFYGRDSVELRQPCDSYISNDGTYTSTSRRTNCSVGSDASVAIHSQTTLYGSVRSNGSIQSESPFGGQVCRSFTSNQCAPSSCEPGAVCVGSSCAVPKIPAFDSWATYCPTHQGSLAPSSGSILTVTGNNPNQRCWNSVSIGNNRVLTLTSTNYPYFIDTLSISNTGRLNFAPSSPSGTITLYVRTIVGDRFNGNQIFNRNNKPYQLRLNYLGSNSLTLNGTAAMSSFIVAPYAPVAVTGNFTFSGGIKATSLTFTGSGSVHYDESGDITTLKDVSYTLRNITQRYR